MKEKSKSKSKSKEDNSNTNVISRIENFHTTNDFDMEYEFGKNKKCILLTLSLVEC